MNILLVEDDARLGSLVQRMLQNEGYDIDWVRSGDCVLQAINDADCEMVILDWMLPVMNGIEVCKSLRSNNYCGGILMLTAKDATDDRVIGLDAGADDYLAKPFEFKELLARLRALSRRSSRQVPLGDIIKIADIELDRQARVVKRGNKEILLTPKEFRILDLMAQNYGKVLPREVILERIWGLESEVSHNNLDAFMRLLRKKIDLPGSDTMIHNIRGVGFKLEAKNDK